MSKIITNQATTKMQKYIDLGRLYNKTIQVRKELDILLEDGKITSVEYHIRQMKVYIEESSKINPNNDSWNKTTLTKMESLEKAWSSDLKDTQKFIEEKQNTTCNGASGQEMFDFFMSELKKEQEEIIQEVKKGFEEDTDFNPEFHQQAI